MNQNGGGGPDFHLPKEILSVIPTDPYDQLDLARKITSIAIASRVSALELESGRLRQKIADKDQLIADLHDQISPLERLFQESESRLRIALEENRKLLKERDMLALTSKKLSRDLSKLEMFKRQLMQSLSDDNSSHQAEEIDLSTSDQSLAGTSSWKDEASSRTGSGISSRSMEMGDPVQNASRHLSHRFSTTPPYVTPRLSPTTTPKVSSTGDSPRAFSTAGSSPKFTSGATSPIKSRFDGHSLSSWYPSSQQSSAPSSPPYGRSLTGHAPRIDGKEFFRLARSRLSYEQFGAFLTNIKELNAHRQSREQTLEKAEEIFGIENKDLYISFRGLLTRSLS